MLAEITTSVQYRLSSYVLRVLLPDKTSQKYGIQVHVGITEIYCVKLVCQILCLSDRPAGVGIFSQDSILSL